MEPDTILSLVRTVVALMGGVWILLALHRCRIERHRQRLFQIRDAVFTFAADGNIAFTHPAYGMVRSTVNGFIRHAHRISLVQMIAFLYLSRRDRLTILTDSFDARWASATRDLDDSVRDHLRNCIRQTNITVGTYLVGPVMPLVLFLLGSAYIATRCVRTVGIVKSRLKRVADELDRTALACGG